MRQNLFKKFILRTSLTFKLIKIMQVNLLKNLTIDHFKHSTKLVFPFELRSEDDWMNDAGSMTVELNHDNYHTKGVVFALYKNVEQLFGKTWQSEEIHKLNLCFVSLPLQTSRFTSLQR